MQSVRSVYFMIFMCLRGIACSRGISFEDLRRIGIRLFEFIQVRNDLQLAKEEIQDLMKTAGSSMAACEPSLYLVILSQLLNVVMLLCV